MRAGWFADIVVFDPARIRDLATYESPIAQSEGVALVIVNGQVSFAGGKARISRTFPGKGSALAPPCTLVALMRKRPRLLFMWSSLFQPP